MKLHRKAIAWMMATCLMYPFTSCIQDEALNAEADIVACEVNSDVLIRQPLITNNEIVFYVNAWSDVSQLAPSFTLTDGATIEPANGTVRDFSKPQTYVVTSQDKKWSKTYTVKCASNELTTEYHFEDIKFFEDPDYLDDNGQPTKRYHIFTETAEDGTTTEWASGNFGFMIPNRMEKATNYPTSQAEDGVEGKCAKLQTVSTGPLGMMFGAPIAAGNLFTGTFEIDLSNMPKSTHFGVPFRKTPQMLTGYYKYVSGEKFTDKTGKVIAGKKDDFDIYAIMYETSAEVPYLDGLNALTHPNIVMMARLKDKQETNEWTRFVIPFETINDKTIDAEKLANGVYNIAIVMSSSIDGGNFNGAVGSTLYVDEINLYYQ